MAKASIARRLAKRTVAAAVENEAGVGQRVGEELDGSVRPDALDGSGGGLGQFFLATAGDDGEEDEEAGEDDQRGEPADCRGGDKDDEEDGEQDDRQAQGGQPAKRPAGAAGAGRCFCLGFGHLVSIRSQRPATHSSESRG